MQISTRNSLLLSFSLVLLIQGAMPAGYMPASVSSGWPFMLCPEGLPVGFLEIVRAGAQNSALPASGHHHLHHDDGALAQDAGQHQHTGDTDYCPLGSSLHTPALIAAAFAMPADATEPVYESSFYLTPALPRAPATSHPRAPPII